MAVSVAESAGRWESTHGSCPSLNSAVLIRPVLSPISSHPRVGIQLASAHQGEAGPLIQRLQTYPPNARPPRSVDTTPR